MAKPKILDQDGRVLKQVNIVYENDKIPVQDEFNFSWKHGWLTLASARLTGREHDVFCVVMHHLQWENTVHAESSKFAKILGMQIGEVSRCLQTLIKKGILVDTGQRIGKTRVLALRSVIGWKGDLKKLHTERSAAQRAAIKAQTKMVNHSESRSSAGVP